HLHFVGYGCHSDLRPLGPAYSRAQKAAIAGSQLIAFVRDLLAGGSSQPDMCAGGGGPWIVRRESQHQHRGRFLVSLRIVGRERSGEKRGKTLLGIFDPLARPVCRGDREVIVKNGKRGVFPLRAVTGGSPGADPPNDSVAFPLEPLQLL